MNYHLLLFACINITCLGFTFPKRGWERCCKKPIKLLFSDHSNTICSKAEEPCVLSVMDSIFQSWQASMIPFVRKSKKALLLNMYLKYSHNSVYYIANNEDDYDDHFASFTINLEASRYSFPSICELYAQNASILSAIVNESEHGLVDFKSFAKQVLNCSTIEMQVFYSTVGSLEFKASNANDYRRYLLLAFHKVHDNPDGKEDYIEELEDYSKKKVRVSRPVDYKYMYNTSAILTDHYASIYEKANKEDKLLYQANNLFNIWETGLNESGKCKKLDIKHFSFDYWGGKYGDEWHSNVYSDSKQLYFSVCDQQFLHPPLECLALHGSINNTSTASNISATVAAEFEELRSNGLSDFRRFSKFFLNCSEVAIRFSYSAAARRLEINAYDVSDDSRGVVMLLQYYHENPRWWLC